MRIVSSHHRTYGQNSIRSRRLSSLISICMLLESFFFFFNNPAPPEISPFPLPAPLPFSLAGGNRVDPRAGLVVHAVVPPQIAGVVIRDRLGHSPPHLQLALGDEPVDELQRVNDFVEIGRAHV